ncbi:proton-conducting transporter membrane subunit [Pedobacter antarcticus]|uniref:Monovalent cation/H+ antiporter subunit D n=2 Tax=Pedobacter antarcticus TaxID=34086 RepID=A0A081PJZ4_9SPHI|nr:proton-conducting transporter membrane subunit [Pedobacter antarcticus]KEQ31017.1 monovalent cation/H+ antiporter subunit D [Pedobacter antarcticus 4BY]SDM27542.1 multisubunit sodium/proton antiporter, MrpD subunit [Pedobacter antarcticus]SFF20831.1 multisubunit sodium/proton antiporter, MrpD subunit (TC 2.A.63.1) [Pedobacter antarcticus]
MTDPFIILPVLLHLLTAILLIFCWKKVRAQKIISVAGNLVIVLLAFGLWMKVWNLGILTMQGGGWEAPFGITFAADTLSATLMLLTGIAGLAVAIYSCAGITKNRIQFGYFPIVHFLLMGLNGAFLAGDIFNLYVWFEVIIISSFVLMTLGGRKPQLEGAINYVTMNLLASVIFLTAIGILYGLTGSLNMADLSIKIADIENRELVHVTAILFFVGFGIKSAVFPLYFWLPSSYNTPPSAIAAIFGGLLTKVGIYALMRVFTLIYIPDSFLKGVFLFVAGATLVTGALGALGKTDIRRLLSYLIICHIGYMLAGLALYTEQAMTGALFYLFHDIVIKTNLFLIAGLIYKIAGTYKMSELGGIYRRYPKLSLVMAAVFFSLVGIPPLSGFWPKLYLISESLNSGSYILLASILIASFITMYVIAKLWAEVFWKEPMVVTDLKAAGFDALSNFKKQLLVIPVIALTALTLYMGFGAQHIAVLAERISTELFHHQPYIDAVFEPKN